MKRKIYKLFSSAKHGLIALVMLVSVTAHSQLSYTFAYTGAVQTLTLPAGVWGIKCWGADGGDVTAGPGGGGKGGYSVGELNVVFSGSLLSIFVGGKGGSASGTSGPAGNGGWNGGGGGGYCGKSGGGGGGAADVRVGGIAASNRIIVAGAGGGASYYNQLATGGNGGAVLAQNGNYMTSGNVLTVGGGGQGANGATPGTGGFSTTNGTSTGGGGGGYSPTGFGQPGTGGGYGGAGGTSAGGSTGGSGGGGAGYAGGAGGTQTVNAGVGGGGGSGYIGGVTNGTTTMLGQPGFVANPDLVGNGRVVITELCNFLLVSSGSNSINPSICSGQSLTLTTTAISNYSWSTGATTSSLVVTPTASTVYFLTALSPSNCTTTKSISVTVSSGFPVLSISNPSNNICLGVTVSLMATGALSYTWTNPGIVNGQTFTPLSTQNYTVTGENGCGTTTAVTTISVAPLQVSTLATPTLVCEGFPAVLTAVASVPNYTWMPGGIVGQSVNVAPMANTLYTVTASDGTCTGTQTVLLTTKVTPTITATGTSTSVCQGDAVVLTAGGGISYSWSPGNIAGATVTVNPLISTLYIVTGTNNVGCYASANHVVVVNPSPTVTILANKTTVCAGDNLSMTAGGASTYTWVNGPQTAGYTITPTSTGIYTVSGLQGTNPCVGTKTILITAIVPNVSVSSSGAICIGGTATLTASGANTYTWNGNPMGTNGNFPVSPPATTIYTLVANTVSGTVICPSTKTIQVIVNPNPTITATATKSLTCKGTTNTLTATGATSYSWGALGSGSTVTVNPLVSTIYTVTGTNATGCTASKMVQTLVSNCNSIGEFTGIKQSITVYPNPNSGAFSINSENDIRLSLINELGQEIRVFNLNGSNSRTVEVKDLPAGVYFIVGQADQTSFNQKIVVTR